MKNQLPRKASFKLPDKKITLDVSKGVTWKNLRKNMSPTFTSGKLKGMLEPMTEVTERFIGHLAKKVNSGQDILELKKLYQGLSLDVIARCAFGINTDSVVNPDADILKFGREAFAAFMPHSWLDTVMFSLPTAYFPGLMKHIPLLPEAYLKLWTITDQIMNTREKQGIKANDYLARLMDLKAQVKENPHGENFEGLNNDIINAQGTIFFVAGYETTASTLTSFSYLLAKHPEIQERVYEEVRDVMERHDGKIDHETIIDMEYLEATVNETLRMMPPILVQLRSCTKDCEVRAFVIKGTQEQGFFIKSYS